VRGTIQSYPGLPFVTGKQITVVEFTVTPRRRPLQIALSWLTKLSMGAEYSVVPLRQSSTIAKLSVILHQLVELETSILMGAEYSVAPLRQSSTIAQLAVILHQLVPGGLAKPYLMAAGFIATVAFQRSQPAL
jgi:hypothetical protein